MRRGLLLTAIASTSITGRARALSNKFHLSSKTKFSLAYTTAALFSVASGSQASSEAERSSCETSTLMTGTGYLNAVNAAALDAELMSTPGFSLEQLMELAGLAVAEAVYQGIPQKGGIGTPRRKILIICGPGNNGGDGLVAARHLYFFGYDCAIVYPKQSKKQHFINLVKQCEDVGISVLDEMPADMDSYDSIVDAIFGFSFKGEPREPFATILQQLKKVQEANNSVKIISVDVPSGWNVDEGDVANTGFVPDMLISLTAPKLCTKNFTGRHFIGGRFLPPKVANKYQVQMPPYDGVSQIMEVNREHIEGGSKAAKESSATGSDDDSWREEYAAFLAEKEQTLEADAKPVTGTEKNDVDENNKSSDEPWEVQYASYCAEKEARLAEEDEKRRESLRKERLE